MTVSSVLIMCLEPDASSIWVAVEPPRGRDKSFGWGLYSGSITYSLWDLGEAVESLRRFKHICTEWGSYAKWEL